MNQRNVFMKKSLKYHWRINFAVALGAAVTTAVLTGALFVGDSVRGSLRDLTLNRLGGIDHALVADRYFRETLVDDLAKTPEFSEDFAEAAPLILISGSAVNAKTKTRASDVTVMGLDERAFDLFYRSQPNNAPDWLSVLKENNGAFPSIVINQALQKELGVEVGDFIVLALQRQSEVHRESLFGNKETADVVRSMRAKVARITPDEGLGRFGLRPHQSLPFNAFLALPELQDRLEQPGSVNGVFATEQNFKIESDGKVGQLQQALKSAVSLVDLGLKLNVQENFLSLESVEFVLKEEISSLAIAIADSLQAPSHPILTYLANEINANGRMTPYSTIVAFDPPEEAAFGNLSLQNGASAPALSDDEIYLNVWAAQDLNANVGDKIDVSYFDVGLRGELAVDTVSFKLKGVLPLFGLSGDRTLAPDFPGVSGAENMADWEPTFPVDFSLIRDKDEVYWDDFRGTPKAFVSAATGQKLWKSRFGHLTMVRIAPTPGDDLQTTRAAFEKSLLERFTPEQAGLRFQPVKKAGLQASAGATDFAGLFFGMSMFLLVSAALLVGLLFRLGVEQRASEIGVLLATGYEQKRIRGMFYKETLVIAGIGCFLGLLGAIAYSSVIMYGLRTWWIGAVGAPFLFLHITPLSLAIGYIGSILIILFSVWWTIRKLGRVPAPALLRGVTELPAIKTGKFVKKLSVGSLVLSLVLVATALILQIDGSAMIFGTSGALLLISGLSFFSIWLKSNRRTEQNASVAFRTSAMSKRNAALFPGRSLLSVALVACACFMIVAVGANQSDFSAAVENKNAGSGGFTLMAEADIPLLSDLNSDDGRFDLGFSSRDSKVLDSLESYALRLLPGEDASCLNLYKPEKPRVLGVPNALLQRGGFGAAGAGQTGTETHSWGLLTEDLGDDIIPAFADANSATYILKVGVGEDIVMQNEYGREVRLRLAGVLNKSLFQSEVLISEENFIRHFPTQSGNAYFLFAPKIQDVPSVAQILEKNLEDYGFDATPVAERLASYQAVENTYMAVFQTLGGLGLLLGTIGLAIVLFRNAVERKKELATMRAFGFRSTKLSSILQFENGFLILLGILIGAVAALIAVFPHIAGTTAQTPWGSLVVTLVAVLLIGLLAGAFAVAVILKLPLLNALRSE